jgi:hypothetical protein
VVENCFMNKNFVFLFIFCLFFFIGNSQNNSKALSYFGFQFKPIFPGDFLSETQINVSDTGFLGKFSQKYGYSFGGTVRVGISKLISIETGINQVKRNYKVDFSLLDSNVVGGTNIGIISYDIPVNAMIYIQLSEKIFSNASLGTSFVYYPSNVGSSNLVDSKYLFVAEGRRNRRFDIEVNANFGFELRTEKNGFYYIGASAKIPFAPIFKVAAIYEESNTISKIGIGEIDGSYLSIDLKYFFPLVKNKGTQFNTGIIL